MCISGSRQPEHPATCQPQLQSRPAPARPAPLPLLHTPPPAPAPTQGRVMMSSSHQVRILVRSLKEGR